jgi:hypothetical protein
MEEHGLKQKDLSDVFGTPSIPSEVSPEMGQWRVCKKGRHRWRPLLLLVEVG